MIAAKEHGGERDKPPAAGHVFIEPAHRAQREPCPAKASDHTGQCHVYVAGTVDIDAERVSGAWMLPN
jgi:hypothetical protein